ncbi:MULTISPECIES: DNA polymerase III subunit delta' C-terminal domain-containing protein [Macrococcus]|uniref:DNA-directed DNA polymerase n=1 Tax=Macrococcus psychrotolerans TaxID=3039389 RepID=A0AAU6RF84_9STAP|nr:MULTISPECIES: DNA polymerase III subunit delta' C-terminal domain-containing protein [Macrococcus]MDJ1112761.1 DNA polymerase III subunit delta' C-terminal domain-containing protein [Macrococcus sp. S115]QYA32829.1 DNA polymerase III subunit delta' [Macrococcus sp. 19Msa1099]QYA37641.1 DNA polymerase III subunit delta' [Macrococcus caseolyticus]QYA76348.1 DNA polymerase III subunit delta' [Macrococcus caseolyticus]
MQQQLMQAIKNDKLSHAYLFEGSNKQALKEEAIIFASAIICGDDEVCHSRIAAHNHSDFIIMETDEATIKKEMIEEVLHKMNQKPIEGSYKVYIIVDFDKVTTQGENSILKFLEEPPGNTIALLLTSAPNEILPTIHSRCQHISVQNRQDISLTLSGQVPTPLLMTLSKLMMSEDEAISWYTEKNFGEVRSQVVTWLQTLLNGDMMGLIQVSQLQSHISERVYQQIALDMVQLFLQDILYLQLNEQSVRSYPDYEVAIQRISQKITIQQSINMIEAALNAKQKLLQYVNATLVFEQMAIKIVGEVRA